MLLVTISLNQVHACSENISQFPFECQLQDRYEVVKSELKNKHNIDVEMLSHYRAIRFLDIFDWKAANRKGNFLPWEIYTPKPKIWLYWERGAHFVNADWVSKISHHITQEDLERAHFAIMTKDIMGKTAKKKKKAVVGEFRYKKNQKSPSWKSKCKGRYALTYDELQLMKNYDLKDQYGSPLVRIKKGKVKECSSGLYEARMVYVESPQVRLEVKRLTNFINDNWSPIKTGKGTMSPLDLSADAQRWFVSIHPVGDGNGRVSRMLQDAIALDFKLPFVPSGLLTWDQTKPKMKYRQHVKDQYNKLMIYLESCLNEYGKGKQISPGCRPLYSRSNEKIKFKSMLDDFLSYEESELKAFYRKYKDIDNIKGDNK